MSLKIYTRIKLSGVCGNIDEGMMRNWQKRVTKIMGNLVYHNKWRNLNSEMNHYLLIVDNDIFLPAPEIWNADTCKN
jgi:hypothetical protein